jgi:hypothetical protein
MALLNARKTVSCKKGVNLSYATLIYKEKIESVMEEKEEFGSDSEPAHQA